MTKGKQHHVIPSKDGGWDVKRSGSDKASVHKETKKEAGDAGRKISKSQDTELVIHRKDGTIEKSDSHGNDPCPPKDKA